MILRRNSFGNKRINTGSHFPEGLKKNRHMKVVNITKILFFNNQIVVRRAIQKKNLERHQRTRSILPILTKTKTNIVQLLIRRNINWNIRLMTLRTYPPKLGLLPMFQPWAKRLDKHLLIVDQIFPRKQSSNTFQNPLHRRDNRLLIMFQVPPAKPGQLIPPPAFQIQSTRLRQPPTTTFYTQTVTQE